MTELPQTTQPSSLWECLHDGGIESIQSDLMARTLTVVVDSPYHWKFHNLPAETRFRILGEDVRIAEAFDFEPWLGATEPLRDMPWAEAAEQRKRDYELGRLISADWNAFAANVTADEDYEIMNAELTPSEPLSVLELGVMSYPNSIYCTVKVHAERFRFYVGERELSLDEFLTFGAAYWENFAQNSLARSAKSE